jgi:penicillin amidase
MERLRRLPDGSVEAEYQGKWEQARILKESISIKDQKPVIQEVIITRHGPVINELASEITTGQPLALRWTALDPDTMIQCLPDLAQARTCQEFHHALKCWTTPAQNVVYADTAGDIGYTLAGKIPIRKKGNGRTPVPGWTDEYEWSEYIPFETLPHLENPPQGYVVTANNRVVGANYPFRMELEPITGDRAQRISELILNPETRHEGDKLSISYIKRMHFDLCSPSARVIARQLAQLPLQSSAHAAETELHAALKIIKDWDGELSAESTAAAIYQVFIRKLIWLIMHDKLDPPANLIESETTPLDPASIKSNATVEQIELTPRFMGKGPTPVLAESCLMGDHWLSWLTDITAHPDSPWFDLGHGETRDDVFHQAFQLTLEELTSRFGPEMKDWTWGTLHQLTFVHPLGSNPILASVFNIGPFPVGGDHTTVLATGSNYHNLDSSQIVGPPYRMIVDLGDLNNSISLLAPGQSGNPASPYFSDQIDAWFQGDYHPILIDRLRIEESTRHTLKLIPMA